MKGVAFVRGNGLSEVVADELSESHDCMKGPLMRT